MFKGYVATSNKTDTITTTDFVVLTKNESGRIILFSCADERVRAELVNALVERNKSVSFFSIPSCNQLKFYSRWFETYVRGNKIFKPQIVDFHSTYTSEEVDLYVDGILNSPDKVMLYQMVSWEDVDITAITN